MTDRYSSITVVLDRDYRSDDAEPILNALRMINGVISVSPHVSDFHAIAAKSQAKHELKMAILDILRDA